MSVEAIKNIKDVEQQAQLLLKESKADAKKIVLDASQNAQEQANQIIGQAEAKAAAVLEAANKSAGAEYDRIIQVTQEECLGIMAEARNHLAKASDIIFERVVTGDGNR